MLLTFWSCNISIADHYKPYVIENKKDDALFNIYANDWNKFIKSVHSEPSCWDTTPKSLSKLTDVSDCWYRGIKKHMSRNEINVNQKIIDAFHDYYSAIFETGKSIQITWIQVASAGGRSDIEGDLLSWGKNVDYLWEDAMSFSKETWIRYAEIQSANFSKETNKKNTVQSGSGFFVNNKGYYITNYHVIDGCSTNSRILISGTEISSKIIATDKLNDLAILKSNLSGNNFLNFSTKSPKKLEKIFVAGYPFGKGLSDDLKFTQGIVSSLKGFQDNSNQIQIDAAINSGNSGGPIVNENGKLIAVAVSGLDKSLSEGIGFGIKSSSVMNFLDVNEIEYSTSSITNYNLSTKKLADILEKGTVYTFCK